MLNLVIFVFKTNEFLRLANFFKDFREGKVFGCLPFLDFSLT